MRAICAAIIALGLLSGCQTTGQVGTDTFVRNTLEGNRTASVAPAAVPVEQEFPAAPDPQS